MANESIYEFISFEFLSEFLTLSKYQVHHSRIKNKTNRTQCRSISNKYTGRAEKERFALDS
jgi:hypothetical protein